jgi:hypothetical protein
MEASIKALVTTWAFDTKEMGKRLSRRAFSAGVESFHKDSEDGGMYHSEII